MPAKAVFDWHMAPCAFDRLVPPWMKVKVVERGGGPSAIGSKMVLKIKVGLFWIRWVVQHVSFEEDHTFTDVQLEGPFKFWKHTHRIRPLDPHRCALEDEIDFCAPIPFLNGMIKKRLERFLRWRHKRLKEDLFHIAKYPSDPMKLLVTGASGFIGSSLCTFLESAGHKVYRLVRHPFQFAENTIVFDPEGTKDLEEFDGVIHLAGESVASGFWTKKKKERLWKSRCEMTSQLTEQLMKLSSPPKVFIGASAIGIYGAKTDQLTDEEGTKGSGFLADLCSAWESASAPIESKGVRRSLARFGLVLSSNGGMLQKVLPSFYAGLGATVGSKEQWISWISLDDAVYGLYHLLMEEGIAGGVNMVAPTLETNLSFAKKLAKSLSRPLWIRVGDKTLEKLFGEMAEEMLLSSQKIEPRKLTQSGYRFSFPNLEEFFKLLFS